MVSCILQGSVLGPLFFIIYIVDKWNYLENKIISYADDTTLYAEVASLSDHIIVANSLNRELFKIQSWCSTWGMKLIPQSKTSHSPHPLLTLCELDQEVSSSITKINTYLILLFLNWTKMSTHLCKFC